VSDIYRPLVSAESADLAEFCAGLDNAQALQQRLAGNVDAGTVHPQWCWTAYDAEGQRVARHYWWGPQHAPSPLVFVPLDVAEPDAAVGMLEHVREQLGVAEAWSEITLPAEIDGDPWTNRPADVALLECGGFRFQVDRVRIEWQSEHGVPHAGDRLSFRPAAGYAEDELVDLFVRVADGSLDHSMREGRETLSNTAEARKRLDFLRHYPGVDDNFVVGVDGSGTAVGYVAAGRATTSGVIAEIGVAQPHRGHGYVHDLLAYGTRVLADAGAPRIVADTDCANTPMRAAFARAGYREFARRWDWGWRRGGSPG
jgi:RimJ/RimL family protein N-acetyltransferase